MAGDSRIGIGKARAIGVLARLASRAYQDAYIVGGTADEYVAPDDLLEDVFSSLHWMEHPTNRPGFAASEVARFSLLAAMIKANEAEIDSCPSGPSLVTDCEAWRRVREAARAALASFGIDGDTLSVDEIDDNSDWEARATWVIQ